MDADTGMGMDDEGAPSARMRTEMRPPPNPVIRYPRLEDLPGAVLESGVGDDANDSDNGDVHGTDNVCITRNSDGRTFTIRSSRTAVQ